RPPGWHRCRRQRVSPGLGGGDGWHAAARACQNACRAAQRARVLVMSTPASPETAAWPDGLLLAYYGDDFTGSTDVMEAFTAAGVPTVLFLDTPGPEALARFPDARCVGIAGSSRGRSPQWMDSELPKPFAALARLGQP